MKLEEATSVRSEGADSEREAPTETGDPSVGVSARAKGAEDADPTGTPVGAPIRGDLFERDLWDEETITQPRIAKSGRSAGNVVAPTYWQPRNLRGDDRVMVEMHMAGFTNREIAAHLGCTPQCVSQVLTGDLAQATIKERVDGMNLEFNGLFRKVIDTISTSMNTDQPIETRLLGADKWLRANGRYARKEAGASVVSAEDVVAKLLERADGAKAVQVNIDHSTHTHLTEVAVAAPAREAGVGPGGGRSFVLDEASELNFLED